MSGSSQANEIMYDIVGLRDAVDRLTRTLNDAREACFAPVSLPMPRFTPPELGFMRVISWLYVHYSEAGKPSIEFLLHQIPASGLDSESNITAHPRTVHQMRTFLQHNLDPTEPQNLAIQLACENWFNRQCGTGVPSEEAHWDGCLVGLLTEAKTFLATILDCIRAIERDEAREQILAQWEFRRKRYHPAHQFDTLIQVAAGDMGHESLDVARFRKRFYEKWTKELQLLSGDYEFAVEARKLIESALLTEMVQRPPLTGVDIMDVFGIMPGPQVGEYLRLAKEIYESNPCSRDELLERLRLRLKPGSA